MKIAYFVHDVTDPAVGRRIRMLRTAGAEVSVLGFRRSDTVVDALEGAPVFDLGRTFDARMTDRAARVLQWTFGAGRLRGEIQDAQLFLARNLETLAIAASARRLAKTPPALVYECLDIHRLMLAGTAAGRLLRLTERRLLTECSLLITSSPAFISGYFAPMQGLDRLGLQTLVVENKLLDLAPPRAFSPRKPGPPWRIGWFGILRCSRSLNVLTALAARRPDLVEVTIRGRPTSAVFADFEAAIEGVPALKFGGPYAPHEIGDLYRGCHFCWSIDWYDEALNSAMLIPNRLYEAGASRCPPLALAGVETGRWLARQGLGVRLDDPLHELEAFFETLTPSAYARLEARMAAADPDLFLANQGECARLLSALTAVLAKPRSVEESVLAPEVLRPSAHRHSLPQRGSEPAGAAR
jgi:hypothetical protein